VSEVAGQKLTALCLFFLIFHRYHHFPKAKKKFEPFLTVIEKTSFQFLASSCSSVCLFVCLFGLLRDTLRRGGGGGRRQTTRPGLDWTRLGHSLRCVLVVVLESGGSVILHSPLSNITTPTDPGRRLLGFICSPKDRRRFCLVLVLILMG